MRGVWIIFNKVAYWLYWEFKGVASAGNVGLVVINPPRVGEVSALCQIGSHVLHCVEGIAKNVYNFT